MSNSVTPQTAARQTPLPSISWSLLKLMSIESVMPSNHLILCHPLLLLPSIFPSISPISNQPALRTKWPYYWSFSFSIRSSNEYSGLISFRIDWYDLLLSVKVWTGIFFFLIHNNPVRYTILRPIFQMQKLKQSMLISLLSQDPTVKTQSGHGTVKWDPRSLELWPFLPILGVRGCSSRTCGLPDSHAPSSLPTKSQLCWSSNTYV